jgi:hypothetical protein
VDVVQGSLAGLPRRSMMAGFVFFCWVLKGDWSHVQQSYASTSCRRYRHYRRRQLFLDTVRLKMRSGYTGREAISLTHSLVFGRRLNCSQG